jgi:hypothetical protein
MTTDRVEYIGLCIYSLTFRILERSSIRQEHVTLRIPIVYVSKTRVAHMEDTSPLSRGSHATFISCSFRNIYPSFYPKISSGGVCLLYL